MRSPTTLLLAVAQALSACDTEPDVRNPDDAGPRETPSPDALAVDGGECGCGPASCGDRACGRSACGYDCGTCDVGAFCFAGGTCVEGLGPGTPCVDAFSGAVWEGDVGLRVCPGDPSQVEACTCSGAGPDAWVACAGTCTTPGCP